MRRRFRAEVANRKAAKSKRSSAPNSSLSPHPKDSALGLDRETIEFEETLFKLG
jgi:hypothetical protein